MGKRGDENSFPPQNKHEKGFRREQRREDRIDALGSGLSPKLEVLRLASTAETPVELSPPTYCLIWLRQMAERAGFEPAVPLLAHILSRDAQSATLSPLLGKLLNKLFHGLRSIEIEIFPNITPSKATLTIFARILDF
jgi:hypothetical protein